jgi:uncharacterized HhH-GPD family protein
VSTTPAERLYLTGDEEADRLLASDPLALLIGFLLDQQVTVQKAFSGPLELRRRVGTLDAAELATMDSARLEEAFARRPALHRFPRAMAGRTQELCRVVVERYGGQAGRIWGEASNARELHRRLRELPGIGEMKAATLIAVLGKRLGVQPAGWQALVPAQMTLGDVDSAEALARYQAGKRAARAAARAGAEARAKA